MDDVVFLEEWEQINGYSDFYNENYLKRAVAPAEALPPRPLKQLKTLTWNPSYKAITHDHMMMNRPSDDQRMMSSSNSTDRDHCVAERKRREKLAQGFVTLSTLIPRLKKVGLHLIYNSFYRTNYSINLMMTA